MAIDYKAIGKRIRRYRKMHDITQEELSNRVDVTCSHISNIENAKTKVSLPLLVDIANALDVSADDLLCDNVKKDKSMVVQAMFADMENMPQLDVWFVEDMVRSTKKRLEQYRDKLEKELEEW